MAPKLICPKRRWGKTDLSIPIIPFGTQGFGNLFGPVTTDEAAVLIRRAVDIGVNHFDCARCYGNSLAKLGNSIQQGVVAREEIIISGRVCCHSAGLWGGYGDGEPNYSCDRVLADIEDQLTILGVNGFDVLLIHDPPNIDPTLAGGGTLEGLEEARARGWVDWVGYGMRPHNFHRQVIESGRVDALLTFNDYNLLNKTADEYLLGLAADQDIGVLNGWSIMRGWLTGAPLESFVAREQWTQDHERAEKMRLWCEERGVSLLQVALQFCLREHRIHGHPIGSLNVEQLEQNVSAAITPIDNSILDEIQQVGL